MRQPSTPTSHPLHGTWGFLETSVARYGEMRVRLVILPVNVSDLERRCWVLLRLWPFAGLLAGVAAGLLVADLLGAGAAIVLGAAVWLAPIVGLWITTRPFLSRIHEEWVTCTIGCEDTDLSRQDLHRAALALSDAEAAWQSGRASRGAFEDAWAGEWERHDPRVLA